MKIITNKINPVEVFLLTFIAIPLPTTRVWKGTAIASLFYVL